MYLVPEGEHRATSLAKPTPATDFAFKTSATNLTTMNPLSVTPAGSPGGALPHNNLQPYLALNFVIAMAGIFPARN